MRDAALPVRSDASERRSDRHVVAIQSSLGPKGEYSPSCRELKVPEVARPQPIIWTVL
jgi:hypothetical protein